MRDALEVAFKAAASEATVLLRGESGTGKGVIARAIHARSPRAAAAFITVPCPALSAELLESELFGHVQGAFTGAIRDTIGKVAVAESGTLFLDEIGDLPLPLQPKLLRLLQERCYERIGETRTRASNVRILAATNRDLEAELAAGRFREDFFYRLNVIEVTLPSLRQRPQDILPLAEHLLRFFARQNSKAISGFAARRGGAARLRLAGQHPRTPQRGRTRRDPRPGAADRNDRLAFAAGKPGASRRRDRLADAGTARIGTHPPHRRRHGHHGRGGGPAGHRPQHPVSQTQEIWNIRRKELKVRS